MTVTRLPVPRRPRQRLVLKVEFDNAAGFRACYLTDLPDGGIRIGTSLELDQRLVLHVSFQGLAEPVQLEAVVRWSVPGSHPEGPASGLAFVDPTPETAAWLADVLDSSTQIFALPAPPPRVLLLEVQPFLREIYSQEVMNWAELHELEMIDLIALGEPEVWLEELAHGATTLGIMDIDELPTSALDLYQRVRARTQVPLIVLGSAAGIEPLTGVTDDALFCLRKPLRFGLLMNTVRLAARDD